MEEIKNFETLSVQEKWNLLALVSNLYYNSDLTQSQIAERLYTSRSKISRMLKEARELGIVKISIMEPWERNLEYEQQLTEAYRLKGVRVFRMKEEETDGGLPKVTEAAAYYMDSILKRDMVVGISWGNTLYRIVKNISANNRKNIPITVVPIMGAANVKSPEKDAMDLAKGLAQAYGGKYHYIYAPLFLQNKEVRESLIQDENIKNVLDMSRNADAILTSIGSIVSKSWNNYLSEKTLEALQARGGIGHIGGHFFDAYGQELKTSLADRMIGISLDDIRRCKDVVCVICGEAKAEAVLGALRGGFIDTLMIDEKCAGRILTRIKEEGE